MALKDIIGQDKAVSMLQGILKRDRLAGAYLFCGESGIGKKTTALNFAKAVNCLKDRNELCVMGNGLKDKDLSLITHHPSPITDFDACEVCDSCCKINAGTHPDVIAIAPEERIIKIEEIRAIEEALSFRPFEGKKKIVIVDDADSMNSSAANAFLKTLEEPPEDSLIILITSRPDRLPATIRSRCSKILFHTHSLISSREILKKKMGDDDADLALRLSLGRPGVALSSDVKEDRDWFMDLLKAMTRAEKDNWASREEMDKWFDLALIFIRDLAVNRITGNTAHVINADLADTLGKTGKSLDVQGIIDLYKELSFIKTMLLFNLNKSLTWNYTACLLRKELYS
ncbi:MAG: DNA polymerase III subunit delta' [Nitrospirae bacterium]|nr:DNA polymerase III subunit delta' [Nitrospirota bacterium]